jgi:hypothetical protein
MFNENRRNLMISVNVKTKKKQNRNKLQIKIFYQYHEELIIFSIDYLIMIYISNTIYNCKIGEIMVFIRKLFGLLSIRRLEEWDN